MKVSEMRDYELLNILEAELLPHRILDMIYDDIHMAEESLPPLTRHKYLHELCGVLCLSISSLNGDISVTRWQLWQLATATPRQRAEAMVRTLGGGE